MRVCKGKAIAFFVLSLVFLPLSALAQGVLPPHIASQIDDAVRGVHGLIQRGAALAGTLDDLRDSSVDSYAAVRSLYFQDRAVELRRGKPADTSELDALFESFE